jgi:toxin ParE1/3/4
MKGYKLSPAAQADVAGIWNFTAARWGIDQAEAYLRRVKAAVEAVAADHRLGRACDEVRSGYWKYPVGSHVLFYRIDQGGIDVVRVLHAHMDFERHL